MLTCSYLLEIQMNNHENAGKYRMLKVEFMVYLEKTNEEVLSDVKCYSTESNLEDGVPHTITDLFSFTKYF